MAPNKLELSLLLTFLKNNGVRASNQNYRNQMRIIIREYFYRIRNIYDKNIVKYFSDDKIKNSKDIQEI